MLRLLATPKFGLLDVYPDLKPLYRSARAARWADVHNYFQALPSNDDPTVPARMVGDIAHVEKELSHAVNDEPSSSWLRTLLAARLIRLGHSSEAPRGYRLPTRRQIVKATGEYEQAEQLLAEASAIDPHNVAAWTLSIETALRLGLGTDEAKRRLMWAEHARPHPVMAQHLVLSHMELDDETFSEDMHAFAYRTMRAAPAGALQGALVAWVHLRVWRTMPAADRADYFTHADVLDDLYQASERSVWNPAFQPVHGWIWAHNVFAMAWSQAGDTAQARRHFEVLDMRASRDPWNLYREPGTGFLSARTAALGWWH